MWKCKMSIQDEGVSIAGSWWRLAVCWLFTISSLDGIGKITQRTLIMSLILWGFPPYYLNVYLPNTHYIEHQDFNIWIILLFSQLVVFNSLQPHWVQHARPPCPSQFPRVFSSSYSLHQWCRPAISSSDPLFSFCQHQWFFQWVICSHQITKTLELQLQHQSFQRIFRV